MAKCILTQANVDRAFCPSKMSKLDLFDVKVSGFLVTVLPSGKKTFSTRTRNHDNKITHRRIGSSDILTLDQARTIAIERLSKLAMGIDPFNEVKTVILSKFIENNYLPYIKNYKRSWNTDVSLLKNHITPVIGHLPLDEIKRHHLVELFAKHRLTHAAGSTNRLIILMRYIFNLAIRWEMEGIVKNPTDNIDLYPNAKKLERFLTPEDAQRLFVALDKSEAPILKYIVAMLLLTGARKNEVLQSKWSDFDFNKRLWLIEFNKSGKPRYVPLSEGAIKLLQELPRIDGCDYPFANPTTKKPFVQIFHAWSVVRQKAGMPELRIHDLRHSFASFLVNSGRSLYEVQKLLGHTQIKTTQRYAHLSNDTLLEAANLAAKSVPLTLVMPNRVDSMPMIMANN